MGQKKSTAPNVDVTSEDFGAVLNCAVRYCFGRQTYMPNLVINFAVPLLPYVSDLTLWVLHRDLEKASELAGKFGNPCIDEPDWKVFMHKVDEELARRKSE